MKTLEALARVRFGDPPCSECGDLRFCVECSYRATPAEIAAFVRSAFDAVIAEVEGEDANRKEYVMLGAHAFARYQRRVLEILKRHRGG